MADLLISLQEFTASLPPVLRWVGVMLAAAIPYVEAEGGAVLGIAAGLHPVIAIAAAIAGNGLALAVVVNATSAVRSGVTARRSGSPATGGVAVIEQDEPSASDAKRARMRRVFNRYGVPGVSILGPLLLPSHVTAAAMVGFGAPKRAVLAWGVIAVGAWAVALGTIAYLGISALVG